MAALPEGDFFTVKQVAEFLNLTPRTVRNLIYRKELRAIHAGREWRVHRADLEAYIESEANKPRA